MYITAELMLLVTSVYILPHNLIFIGICLFYFQLKGISTDKFIKDEQHSMRMHDCGVFGYRGLTGECLIS